MKELLQCILCTARVLVLHEIEMGKKHAPDAWTVWFAKAFQIELMALTSFIWRLRTALATESPLE